MGGPFGVINEHYQGWDTPILPVVEPPKPVIVIEPTKKVSAKPVKKQVVEKKKLMFTEGD